MLSLLMHQASINELYQRVCTLKGVDIQKVRQSLLGVFFLHQRIILLFSCSNLKVLLLDYLCSLSGSMLPLLTNFLLIFLWQVQIRDYFNKQRGKLLTRSTKSVEENNLQMDQDVSIPSSKSNRCWLSMYRYFFSRLGVHTHLLQAKSFWNGNENFHLTRHSFTWIFFCSAP